MQSENSDTCVLCCRKTSIFAVGVCDHPVCHECCTRMRVLLHKNECPICRQDLPQVIFSDRLRKFQVPSETSRRDATYSIFFDSSKTESSFYSLLEHACTLCKNKQIFPNFIQLKDHYRRFHERYYCNLCVENLKLFSFERKSYTRSELGRHRRSGDTDNTSLTGHPLCQFCDERYMDDDELFRHLRKDHFFCHFCDADGKQHVFYCNYASIRDHFSRDHFLCEEGDCKNEHFTSVFRTDIDYRAHKAIAHSKNLSKAKAKQARTLELDFTLAPRPRQQHYPHTENIPTDESIPSLTFRKKNKDAIQKDDIIARNGFNDNQENNNSTDAVIQKTTQLNLSKDFPTLNGSPINGSERRNKNNEPILTLAWNPGKNNRLSSDERNNESFPALSSASPPQYSDVWPLNNNDSKTACTSHSVKSVKLPLKSTHEFPALEQKKKNNIAKLSAEVEKQPQQQLKTRTNSKKIDEFEKQQKLRTTAKKNEGARSKISNDEDSFNSTNGKNDAPVQSPAKTVKAKSTSPVLKEEDFPELKSTSKIINNPPTVDSVADTKKKQTNTKTYSEKMRTVSKQRSANAVTTVKGDGFSLQGLANALKKPSGSTRNSSKQKSVENDQVKNKNGADQKVSENKAKNHSKNNNFFNENSASNERTNSEPVPFNCWKSKMSQILSGSADNAQANLNFLNLNTYTPPNNFQNRNKELIKKIKTLFNHSTSSFAEFKTISGQFRQNLLPADEYYKNCISLMGAKEFELLFPELLVLLPDIKKQKELLNVHNSVQRINQPSKMIQFLTCATCHQILSVDDFQQHKRVH